METLTLTKTIKATALIGGFSILAIGIIAIWVLLMMRLLKSNVSAKEIENTNVELEVGDWLLGIIKFGSIILCPIALYWILRFMLSVFVVCVWLLHFGRIDDIFKGFVLAMFGLFFLALGVFIGFKWIKDIAKESAVKRGNK